MSAALQNGIRVRLFLIILLAALVRVARVYSSASVHKASGLLETNFYLYGLVLFCSLLPFKKTWFVAILGQAAATFLGLAAAGLGLLATLRCRTQTGCIQTLPASAVTLVLVAAIFGLDILQTWDVYRIIRAPMFDSSGTQRVRILFSWALPFGWLVNILLYTDSQWSMFKFTTAHLFVDPLVILLANANDDIFVGAMIGTVIAMDLLAWNMHTDTLAKSATAVQLGLSVCALLIHLVAGSVPTEAEAQPDPEPAFEVAESEVNTLRQRKSTNIKIKF